MNANEEPEVQIRRVSVNLCENCIAGVSGQCHVPECLFCRFNIEDTQQPLRYLIHQSRVFRNGEVVPAGVCVLYESGDVGYLDDTGDCDCEDVEHGQCEEHSYEVTNGNSGPLVEVILPDYDAELDATRPSRKLLHP
jgi:hypothetical protein